MTEKSPTIFPVFCRLRMADAKGQSLFAKANHSVRIDGWLDEPKKRRRSQVCDTFREGGSRYWVSQIVTAWNLDNISPLDLSNLLGTSLSQISRLLNHSSASLGVLGQFAARHGYSIPTPNFHRWSIKGLVTALQKTAWLRQVSRTRSNRTGLPPKLSEHYIYILATLVSGELIDRWDALTDQYEDDLFSAANDRNFAKFLQRFTASYLRLTQHIPAAQSRSAIYFPNGRISDPSRWELCRDIDAMWRESYADVERTWAAVNGLTPWEIGLMEADDDEAA